MKAAIFYYPNIGKKNQKSGKVPLYMRVVFKRSKAEHRLSCDINTTDVLKWDPITMRLLERNHPVNHQLNRLDQNSMTF